MPNPKVRFPSVFGFNTFKQVVLRQFGKPIRVDLARRRDPHALEPSANMELAVQGEPNESSNLAGARVGVVPNFGQHLPFVKLLKLNCWMKERIIGTLDYQFKFIYPHLTK